MLIEFVEIKLKINLLTISFFFSLDDLNELDNNIFILLSELQSYIRI